MEEGAGWPAAAWAGGRGALRGDGLKEVMVASRSLSRWPGCALRCLAVAAVAGKRARLLPGSSGGQGQLGGSSPQPHGLLANPCPTGNGTRASRSCGLRQSRQLSQCS